MGVADLQTNSTEDEAAAPAVGSDVTPLARLRGFHPGWFGAGLGTAIVGLAALLNPGSVAALVQPARTLGQVMAVLAVVLTVGYLGRFVLHTERRADGPVRPGGRRPLRHPARRHPRPHRTGLSTSPLNRLLLSPTHGLAEYLPFMDRCGTSSTV